MSESLVIFDCDGVLVDSEILVVEIEAEMLGAVGIELTAIEVAAMFVGLSESDMARLIAERWSVELSEDFHDRKTARIQEAFETDLRPIAGMIDLLAASAHRRCVASSSAPERIRRALELTDILTHFTHLFSASEVARGKPAPDLFLHAASTLGADPERCVVVEDSPAGVTAGVSAGMQVIGFTAGGHCQPTHAKTLREHGAVHVATNAGELAELLDTLCS